MNRTSQTFRSEHFIFHFFAENWLISELSCSFLVVNYFFLHVTHFFFTRTAHSHCEVKSTLQIFSLRLSCCSSFLGCIVRALSARSRCENGIRAISESLRLEIRIRASVRGKRRQARYFHALSRNSISLDFCLPHNNSLRE